VPSASATVLLSVCFRSWNLWTITMLMSELSVASGWRSPAGLDHIHTAADQRGRVAQLFFQVLPVIHQHDLVVAQIAAGAQHARQKHHGQRLARALRVPHHTAALGGGLAVAQPLMTLPAARNCW
jgi:hypothetical protein